MIPKEATFLSILAISLLTLAPIFQIVVAQDAPPAEGDAAAPAGDAAAPAGDAAAPAGDAAPPAGGDAAAAGGAAPAAGDAAPAAGGAAAAADGTTPEAGDATTAAGDASTAEGVTDESGGSNGTKPAKIGGYIPPRGTTTTRSRTRKATTKRNFFATTRKPWSTPSLYKCNKNIGVKGNGNGGPLPCIDTTVSTASPPPKVTAFKHPDPSDPKYNNPGQIRDREKKHRPQLGYLGDAWEKRFEKGYSPAYQDYCAPYHCNDYHRTACGLHRASMRFEWFQSNCHVRIHNLCARWTGAQQFDTVDVSFCIHYSMFPNVPKFMSRAGCPANCEGSVDPLCAFSVYDGHVVLFKSRCHFQQVNCNIATYNEYEEAKLDWCKLSYIGDGSKTI